MRLSHNPRTAGSNFQRHIASMEATKGSKQSKTSCAAVPWLRQQVTASLMSLRESKPYAH